MEGQILCWVFKAIWLVAIVLLINMGLMPFGYNMFQTELFETTLSWAVQPLHYIALVAGLLGAYRFVMRLMGKDAGCGSTGCPCNCSTCTCK